MDNCVRKIAQDRKHELFLLLRDKLMDALNEEGADPKEEAADLATTFYLWGEKFKSIDKLVEEFEEYGSTDAEARLQAVRRILAL